MMLDIIKRDEIRQDELITNHNNLLYSTLITCKEFAEFVEEFNHDPITIKNMDIEDFSIMY